MHQIYGLALTFPSLNDRNVSVNGSEVAVLETFSSSERFLNKNSYSMKISKKSCKNIQKYY